MLPEDAQGLAEWLIDRQCNLRDATEFGDLRSVGHLSRCDRRRSREVTGVGRFEPRHVNGVKHGAVRGQNLWTVAFARFDMKEFSAREARYGLRGVAASHPGPPKFSRCRSR